MAAMKASSIPAVRVESDLREQLERVLHEGETLSSFVEASVRESVRRRVERAEFMARGLASLDAARQSGQYVPAEQVIATLQDRLDKVRRKVAGKPVRRR
jgi:hypothetical protein